MTPAESAAAEPLYQLGECHRFEGGGRHFLYLVPAGAIFELDGAGRRALDLLRESSFPHEDLLRRLQASGVAPEDAGELLGELYRARVIVSADTRSEPLAEPPEDFPLQSLVMNLTNQCNLSPLGQYCYEFGARTASRLPEGKAEVHGPRDRASVSGFPVWASRPAAPCTLGSSAEKR